MSERLVVRGGFVISMDADVGDIQGGSVVVENGVVTHVGPDVDVSDAEVIDATNCVVIPGFVDGHRHLWQTFLRGMLPNCTLPTYMRDMLGRVAPHIGPEEGHVGTLLGALECLNAGITTVFDWSHALRTPEDSDARVAALLASGIRGYYAPNGPAAAEWYSWTAPQPHPDDIRRLRSQYFSSDHGRVRLAAGLRSPGQVPDSVITADWQTARELDLLIQIHAGTRRVGGESHEVDALHALGLLGADVCFAHGNQFSDSELDMITEVGAGVAVSPYAELVGGHGPLELCRLRAHGVLPALSADATAMAPGDMFSQLRTAFTSARAEQLPLDATAPYEPTVEARDVLELATISGARAIGLGDVCGSVSVGKAGDLVVIRGDAVNTAPMVDPVATVVLSADTSNVDTVIVGGRVVKRHGVLTGADIGAVVEQSAQARDRVLRAADWHFASRPGAG